MTHSSQHGAAALPITLMLAFALMLAVLFANRSVVFEVRSSINEVHAAQADEAAQAGLAWALAQLNRTTPIDEACQASAAASALPWHERARLAPVQASCISQANGWACHCPASGEPRSVDNADAPAFSLHLLPDPSQTGLWTLRVTGRSGRPGPDARRQLNIARLPGLDTPPAAALTVRGHATLGAGLAVFHTLPASGGLTLQAGTGVEGADLIQLTSTPGTPSSASLIDTDAALSALTPQGLHASVFRLDAAAWREQPAAHDVTCSSACDSALQSALQQHQLLTLSGGLRLAGPITIGTPEKPVVLVVDGPVELQAGGVIHGLVYLRYSEWVDHGGTTIHGALIAENDLHTQGATHIHHDAAVLQALQQRTGTHAPVAGSWRDL